jgi:ATP-dependent RNA helicase DDX52/ROK1
VLKQSNCAVPDYILALPKPSRMKKRMLKKKPVERKAVGIVAGRGIGKGDAVKRKQMIDASKRRKARETEEWSGVQSES